MIWLLVFIFFSYTILIVSLAIGFDKVDDFNPKNHDSKTIFSVVIPFRNEAKNLPFLVKSIQEINYPKELVEFLFVDDDSTDDSVEIIGKLLFEKTIPFKIIKNRRTSNSPKKDAISAAIQQAKGSWIITADADCILPKNWLKIVDNFILTHSPKMVVAPVSYKIKNSFFNQFQLLDFLSLQGSTIGGFGIKKPFLCNGANLAYEKETFIQLNGFDGNNHIASGDDIFLFEKFIELNSNCVQFLKSKEAIVTTFPVKNFKALMNQRVRWAAKSGSYNLWFGKLVGIIVLTANLLIVIAVFLLFFKQISLFNLLLILGFKYFIDLLLLYKSITFFNQIKLLQSYFLSSLVYPFFSVFIVLKSFFSSYKWKERSFKK